MHPSRGSDDLMNISRGGDARFRHDRIRNAWMRFFGYKALEIATARELDHLI